MHEPQTQRPHVGPLPHGQGRQGHPLRWRGRLAQALEDAVRAFDHGVAHPVRIGAAAARVVVAGIGRRQLGLDVASQRLVHQHLTLHAGEGVRIGVEPMEVAVEDQPLASALAPEQFQHALERQLVAVQPANHVQHVQPLQMRRRLDREVLRPVSVVQRAAAPGS